MKKLGNKGLTLIELLVSVILISIIMLCAERLVNQLIYAKNNSMTAVDNQITRSIIIDTIQADLLVYGISYDGLTVTKNGSEIIFSLSVPGKERKSVITLSEKYLYYTSFSGKETHLDYKNCTGSTDLSLNPNNYIQYFGDYIFLQIHIPIYTKNTLNDRDNNNIIDDIILTYYGKYSV